MSGDIPGTVKCSEDVLKMETIVPLIIEEEVTDTNRLSVRYAIEYSKELP